MGERDMPMLFNVEPIPKLGEPSVSLILEDDVIRGLVRQGCLEAKDIADPAKIIAAISFFLRGMLGDAVPQKMMSTTRQ
jgi:hypothetical protein